MQVLCLLLVAIVAKNPVAVAADGVLTSADCSGKENGNYAHPKKCTHYLTCSNGVAYEMPCPLDSLGEHMYYNESLGYCVDRSVGTCDNDLGPVPKTCSSGYPRSCSEIEHESESTRNAPQLQKCKIYPNGPNREGLDVLCDFETDAADGGWTIIQKRSSGPKGEFNLTWNEYVAGFGSLDRNFWLGLENIRALTKSGDQELRIELEDWEGEKRWAKYSQLLISDASDFYRLTISGFSKNSTAGDSMTFEVESNNGKRFTTKDLNNGISPNCAVVYESGGWWHGYGTCSFAGLNGRYREKGEPLPYSWSGILWWSWRQPYSFAKTEMKIRKKK